MAILIDLLGAQVSASVSFNGGSEYVKSVFRAVLERCGADRLHVLLSRDGILEPSFGQEIRLSIPETRIHCIEDHPSLAELATRHEIDSAFIGIMQRYRAYTSFLSAPKPELNIVCALLDLVEFETSPGIDHILFERIDGMRSWLRLAKHALSRRRRARHAREATQTTFDLFSRNFSVRWITSSEYSKSSIVLHLGAAPDTIDVLWCPPSPNQLSFIESELPTDENTCTAGPFVLLGADRWSKNFRTAVKAGRILRSSGIPFHLIAVGNFRNKPIHRILSGTPWISFRDYGPAHEIRDLLASCRALLFPTLCEGFGYPPLEAMCLGKPTLASVATSVPEITGAAARYFAPNDAKHLAHHIRTLVHSLPPTPSPRELRMMALDRLRRQRDDLKRMVDLIQVDAHAHREPAKHALAS